MEGARQIGECLASLGPAQSILDKHPSGLSRMAPNGRFERRWQLSSPRAGSPASKCNLPFLYELPSRTQTGRNRMKLAIASTVALLLLFAAQTPASATSAQVLVQRQAVGQGEVTVDKVRWRGGWGRRGWGWGGYGYRAYRPPGAPTMATATIPRSMATTIGHIHTGAGVTAGAIGAGTGTGNLRAKGADAVRGARPAFLRPKTRRSGTGGSCCNGSTLLAWSGRESRPQVREISG
jgi:hypothetical protein